MKTTILLRVLPFASLLFLFSDSSAQELAINSVNSNRNEKTESISNKPEDELLPADANSSITAKVLRNFDRQFKNATEIKTSPLATGTLIYCKIDGIKNEIYYDKKGRLSHSIRYYNESNLCSSVRDVVLDKYNGYDIFGVTEITVNDLKAYQVKLQSRSTWKTVQVVGDSMTETESFKM